MDEDAEHPGGVYVTRCGQHLVRSASLYDEAPGWMCLSCLRGTEAVVAGTVTASCGVTIVPLSEGNHPSGVLKARCGAVMMSVTQHERLPPGLTCERCRLEADNGTTERD